MEVNKTKKDLQLKAFKSQNEWRLWLSKNHAKSSGIWLIFFKKDSGKQTFKFDEALDEALCYGWIDGQAKSYDGESYLQKFTPRRPKGTWSKRNTENIERLIKEGKMTPAGLKEVEEAKADGRWKVAYDPPSTMQIPKDFLKELSKNKKAKAFFETLNKTNIYAIGWRLQTAKKEETREKRMKVILEMLSKGKKFY